MTWSIDDTQPGAEAYSKGIWPQWIQAIHTAIQSFAKWEYDNALAQHYGSRFEGVDTWIGLTRHTQAALLNARIRELETKTFERSFGEPIRRPLNSGDLRPRIDLQKLKSAEQLEKARPDPPSPEAYARPVPDVSTLGRLIPGWRRRHEHELEIARHSASEALRTATAKYERAFAEWEADFQKAKKVAEDYEEELGSQRRIAETVLQAFSEADCTAVTLVLERILDGLKFPRPVPRPPYRIEIGADGSEAVIQFLILPSVAISGIQELVFNGMVDAHSDGEDLGCFLVVDIDDDRREFLAAALARSMTVRILLEVFHRQPHPTIQRLTVVGVSEISDASRGTSALQPLISVSASPWDLDGVVIERVEAGPFLSRLGAREAPSLSGPPIRPFVEFGSLRASAEPTALVSGIDFEHFVAELLRRMGLRAQVTQASRDGGVDIWAEDPRPLLGGAVAVQTKRYSKPVGVGAVRDLYGTLLSTGASKAVLVTTSTFSSDARAFSEGKPIELIDGTTLALLAEEYGLPLFGESSPEWVDLLGDQCSD